MEGVVQWKGRRYVYDGGRHGFDKGRNVRFGKQMHVFIGILPEVADVRGDDWRAAGESLDEFGGKSSIVAQV